MPMSQVKLQPSASGGSSHLQLIVSLGYNPMLNGNQWDNPFRGCTNQAYQPRTLRAVSGARVAVPRNTELLLSCSAAGGMPSVALEACRARLPKPYKSEPFAPWRKKTFDETP